MVGFDLKNPEETLFVEVKGNRGHPLGRGSNSKKRPVPIFLYRLLLRRFKRQSFKVIVDGHGKDATHSWQLKQVFVTGQLPHLRKLGDC